MRSTRQYLESSSRTPLLPFPVIRVPTRTTRNALMSIRNGPMKPGSLCHLSDTSIQQMTIARPWISARERSLETVPWDRLLCTPSMRQSRKNWLLGWRLRRRTTSVLLLEIPAMISSESKYGIVRSTVASAHQLLGRRVMVPCKSGSSISRKESLIMKTTCHRTSVSTQTGLALRSRSQVVTSGRTSIRRHLSVT